MNNFKLNLHHSPPDRRDYKVKVKNAKPLKFNTVDLSSYCTSIKDQGYIGSCTAYAVIGLMEYLHKRAVNDGSEDIYSEKFTYYDTRVNQLGWSANEDTGAYIRNAVSSIVKTGAAPEKLFPYDNNYSEIPSQAVFDAAQFNQVVSYANIPDGNNDEERKQSLEDCKQLLQEGYPIVGGFVCYDSIWSAVNGIIPGPGGTMIGGHAILIVGYDDANRLFKFKNSWSENWGDKGYGYLPYDYLLQGVLWDLWTVFSQESFGDDNIIDIEKPSPEDETKQEKDELIKLWSSIVNSTQELKLQVDQNADIQRYIIDAHNAIKNSIDKLNVLERQINSQKDIVSDKIKSIQDKVYTTYELITKQ